MFYKINNLYNFFLELLDTENHVDKHIGKIESIKKIKKISLINRIFHGKNRTKLIINKKAYTIKGDLPLNYKGSLVLMREFPFNKGYSSNFLIIKNKAYLLF